MVHVLYHHHARRVDFGGKCAPAGSTRELLPALLRRAPLLDLPPNDVGRHPAGQRRRRTADGGSTRSKGKR
jgi:hypothetical protein